MKWHYLLVSFYYILFVVRGKTEKTEREKEMSTSSSFLPRSLKNHGIQADAKSQECDPGFWHGWKECRDVSVITVITGLPQQEARSRCWSWLTGTVMWALGILIHILPNLLNIHSSTIFLDYAEVGQSSLARGKLDLQLYLLLQNRNPSHVLTLWLYPSLRRMG